MGAGPKLGLDSVQNDGDIDTHIEHGELFQDCAEFLLERVLGELDLAHVEVPDSADLVVFMDDLYTTVCSRNIYHFCTEVSARRRCLPLRLGQYNVQEIAGRWNGRNGFEAFRRHDCMFVLRDGRCGRLVSASLKFLASRLSPAADLFVCKPTT
jgi:hypothetical protein